MSASGTATPVSPAENVSAKRGLRPLIASPAHRARALVADIVVGPGPGPAGEEDFTGPISNLKERNVDVVCYGGGHPESGLIVRQARELGLGAQAIAGDGAMSATAGRAAPAAPPLQWRQATRMLVIA